MSGIKAFDNIIEKKLLNLHTAYLAKVISSNGSKAKIQPLGMTKAVGEAAQNQSVLSNVPVINSARYKAVIEEETIARVVPIGAGDIVVCICCERDITAAKKGKNSLPAFGHHSMSDSVIVGVL